MDMNPERVDYRTEPSRYRHWKLAFDGPVATLSMDVAEDAGLRPGYKLKLNSYDLGVDIELADALNRIRFEHPETRAVIVTSAKDRIFCSGANIFMLGASAHAWKVNFCKFTNETRNGIEDSSRHSGIRFVAALNGTCAGGGYELALACDEIVLVDDRSSAVSLPEVPLLGVLPGTGGLTRLTDKRRVRHDLADLFCTTAEGVRGQRALDWKLVDAIVKPAQFMQAVKERAQRLAGESKRPRDAKPVALPRIERRDTPERIDYEHVSVAIDRGAGAAIRAVTEATAARRAARLDPVVTRLVTLPTRYVAGEETALVNFVNGGLAKPTFVPPRPFERGIAGRPTLIQNVETLAHLALIARHGPDWFRELGTSDEPGSTLVTVSGVVASPTVCEIGLGTPVRDVVTAAGGATQEVAAFLIGGYYGSWMAADDAWDVPLTNAALKARGAALGTGVVRLSLATVAQAWLPGDPNR